MNVDVDVTSWRVGVCGPEASIPGPGVIQGKGGKEKINSGFGCVLQLRALRT